MYRTRRQTNPQATNAQPARRGGVLGALNFSNPDGPALTFNKLNFSLSPVLTANLPDLTGTTESFALSAIKHNNTFLLGNVDPVYLLCFSRRPTKYTDANMAIFGRQWQGVLSAEQIAEIESGVLNGWDAVVDSLTSRYAEAARPYVEFFYSSEAQAKRRERQSALEAAKAPRSVVVTNMYGGQSQITASLSASANTADYNALLSKYRPSKNKVENYTDLELWVRYIAVKIFCRPNTSVKDEILSEPDKRVINVALSMYTGFAPNATASWDGSAFVEVIDGKPQLKRDPDIMRFWETVWIARDFGAGYQAFFDIKAQQLGYTADFVGFDQWRDFKDASPEKLKELDTAFNNMIQLMSDGAAYGAYARPMGILFGELPVEITTPIQKHLPPEYFNDGYGWQVDIGRNLANAEFFARWVLTGANPELKPIYLPTIQKPSSWDKFKAVAIPVALLVVGFFAGPAIMGQFMSLAAGASSTTATIATQLAGKALAVKMASAAKNKAMEYYFRGALEGDIHRAQGEAITAENLRRETEGVKEQTAIINAEIAALQAESRKPLIAAPSKGQAFIASALVAAAAFWVM